MSQSHLTIKERESLLEYTAKGCRQSEIARLLRRDKSVISRELSRNRSEDGMYSPSEAEAKYRKRRKNCCRKKILADPAVSVEIRKCITYNGWSPEQISQRFKMEDNPIKISYTTIYRGLDEGLIRDTAKQYLRIKYKKGKSSDPEEKRGKIVGARSICERSTAAVERSQIGHWEADTVIGSKQSGCILTLVDRKSRFLLAGLLKNKTKEDVEAAFKELFAEIPSEKRLSVTPDCGKEFFCHENVSKEHQVPFFFCDPASPWQRPTNENTNGLLRQYFPKRSIFTDYLPEDFRKAFALINLRPRKCLHWKTPYEVFFNVSLHLA